MSRPKHGLTARDIEIAVAQHFDYRRHVIVPNVSWGLGLKHEADMLVLSKSGYCKEIEIKISASDIKADLAKRHPHFEGPIREVWFAVPAELANDPRIPAAYGVLAIEQWPDMRWRGGTSLKVKAVRPSMISKTAVPLKQDRIMKLCRLGCMRIWSLRRTEKCGV